MRRPRLRIPLQGRSPRSSPLRALIPHRQGAHADNLRSSHRSDRPSQGQAGRRTRRFPAIPAGEWAPRAPFTKGESGMATTEATRSVGGPDHHPEIDWEAAERSPEFRELIRKKRSFVVPATVFFLAWYFGFVILAGYAPDFMGREFLTDGLTVGYVLALSQ